MSGPRKIDFLRQIVNRVLVEEQKLPPQLVDDIRKQVAQAEDKYGFSAFGGDVAKLAEYLKSKDFDNLIASFKAVDALHVLEKILLKAKEYYKDYSEIVEAIDKRLDEIKRVAGKTSSTPRESKE